MRKSSKRASRNAVSTNPRKPRSRLLGGFAGDFSPKGFERQRFPRSAESEPHNTCGKPHRNPEPMAKSGLISCKTIQKSQGMGACEEEGFAARVLPLALRPLFTKRHPYWRLHNYPDRLSGHVSIISNTRYICNARQSPASPAIHVIARIAVADNHLSSRSPSSWNSC